MGDTFVSMTRPPLFFRKLRESNLEPRSYIGQGEALILQVRSSSGDPVTLAVRTLDPDGEVKFHQYQITPASDRTMSALIVPMQECILLSAIADVGNGEITRGSTYCSIHIRRAPGSAAPGFEFLAHGYVDGTYRLTFPGGHHESSRHGPGRLRAILGTNPAAGVEISETVPTNALWRFISFFATLVTDATVANRNFRLILDDGTNTIQSVVNGTNITASLTQPVTVATGIFPQATAGVFMQTDIGADVLLPAGSRIRTSTIGLQAGDNWSAPLLLVEEWIVEA